MPVSLILAGAAAVILLGAALNDVALRMIPNWMPATLLLLGGCIRMLDGRLLPGVLAGILVLLGAACCWNRGWLGGGDVKLLAACALLVPPDRAPAMLLDTALAGGALGLLYLALRRLPRRPWATRPAGLLRRVIRVERHRIRRHGPLPYASAIAAGALLVLLKG